jgi:hypothetical protein
MARNGKHRLPWNGSGVMFGPYVLYRTGAGLGAGAVGTGCREGSTGRCSCSMAGWRLKLSLPGWRFSILAAVMAEIRVSEDLGVIRATTSVWELTMAGAGHSRQP